MFFRLDDALRGEDVSDFWMVWSGTAEAALAGAYSLAGSFVFSRSPARGLSGLADLKVR